LNRSAAIKGQPAGQLQASPQNNMKIMNRCGSHDEWLIGPQGATSLMIGESPENVTPWRHIEQRERPRVVNETSSDD
jgi:hypothetical protein